MEFNISQISDSVKEIEVKLSYDEIQDDINKEVKKRTQNLQIDGFRKGKVPQHIIKKMFGDALEYEASEKVANNYFWDIVEREDIKVLDKPIMTHLDFVNGEKLDFKIKFETFPDIQLKEYTGIEIEVPDHQVTDEQVEQEIKYILKTNRQYETVDEVGDGRDYVLETEVIRVDENGNPTSEMKPEKFNIDLSTENIYSEIIENSKNKKVGETFIFTYVEDDDESESNETTNQPKKYFYKAKILGIKKIILPELNEEFVKNFTKDRISTVEEFKKDIKENMQRYYDDKINEMIEIKLVDEIIKRNDFEPPKILLKNMLEEYLKDEENYYKKNKWYFNREEASERLSKRVEKDVKWLLLRDEIIKKENIAVTDEELTEKARKESKESGLPIERIMNYYSSSNYKSKLLDQKLFDFLFEKNVIKRVNQKSHNKNEEDNEKQD